jgi:hypothetical protein
VGGPFDGGTARAARLAVAWLDEQGGAYEAPGGGRAPYHLEANGRWVFAGHGARECPVCGCFVRQRAEDGSRLLSCPLCGGSL